MGLIFYKKVKMNRNNIPKYYENETLNAIKGISLSLDKLNISVEKLIVEMKNLIKNLNKDK